MADLNLSRSPILLMSGSANRELSEELSEHLGQPLCKVTLRRFADGEIFVKIDENVRGRDVYIIQPTNPPAENLLRLVPGLTLEAADRGCSGMAGTFGLAREHYRASLRIGLGLVSAMRGSVAAGATECSACRMQMEQGTSKPTVHPVKLLAKAYGLLEGAAPLGLDDMLTTPSGSLTTSS
jgi:hypothetical protein